MCGSFARSMSRDQHAVGIVRDLAHGHVAILELCNMFFSITA